MIAQSNDILPLHNESFLDRGQIVRSDVIKILPHCDLYGFSKEVHQEIARLTRQGQIVRYDDYTFPKVKRGYALRNLELSIKEQQKQETLRSLQQGSWNSVPGLVERQIKRLEQNVI